MAFEEYIKMALSQITTYEKKDMQIGDYPYVVYECFNPDIYKHMGGFHGYMLVLKREEPEDKGIQIEGPQQYHAGDFEDRLVYMPMQEYNRYDGEIYYGIMLDTCEDIFIKSFIEFTTFVKGLRFD